MNLLRLFPPKLPPMRSILFVCTANVTRSPAAAAMFRAEAAKFGETWSVASAGTKAFRGSPPNPVVSFIMFQRGFPISKHRSKRITKKLMRNYKWIMVMEESQRELLVKNHPKYTSNIFVLRKFGLEPAEQELNMPDPTGKEPDDYRELFALLDVEIPRIFKLLQQKISDLEWGQPVEEE